MESNPAYPIASVPETSPGGRGSGGQLIAADFDPRAATVRLLQLFALAGLAILAAGFYFVPQRAWANLLLGAYYVAGLGLAGVVFVAIEYVSGAGWCVAFRRVPEALAETLPLGAVLLAAALLGGVYFCPWAIDSHESMGPGMWFKEMWLSVSFVLARAAVYIGLWIWLARRIVAHSRRQDQDGGIAHTRANARLSAAFLVVFGVTFWLASFDWIMSLEPHWYSTLFGVYHFAGLFLSGLAMIAIVAIRLERLGPLRGILTAEHLHDLGKLIFAFSAFWMYIWFSQYMLIWYANIPEETTYFIRRLEGFWEPVFVLNVLLNWLVPFLVLLHVPAKRSPGLMLKVCWVILVGRWVDLYLMIFPALTGGSPLFGIWEAGIMVGIVGGFFLSLLHGLRRAALVPLKDPFLSESLHYHN